MTSQERSNLTLAESYLYNAIFTSDNFSTANVSHMTRGLRCGESVHDKDYNKKVRVIVLYLTIIFGVIGGSLVFLWMWKNRRLKSRVNYLILNLTMADMMVMLLAAVPQLIWEYQDQRSWYAGAFLCKTVKFCQSFSIMASTNMLVVIALDRHQAITRPLKTTLPVWQMTGAAWVLSALASSPMLFVFRLNHTKTGIPKCENIFRGKPVFHRQVFLTYATIMVFVIPLAVLTISYIRIFLTIARKTRGNRLTKRRNGSKKPGKVTLQSTGSKSLPKAKIKTLKMTFVIVMVFVTCGVPYFIGEMIMSYGDPCSISMLVYGLLGGLAAANSAANPYVFLVFNINRKATHDTRRTFSDRNGTIRNFIFSTASTRSSYMADSKCMYQSSVKNSVRR